MFEREGLFFVCEVGGQGAQLIVPIPCPHLLVGVGIGEVLDESAWIEVCFLSSISVFTWRNSRDALEIFAKGRL